MKPAAKIWDLFYGAALIAGAAFSAFFIVLIGFFTLRPSADGRLIGVVALTFSTIAFVGACFWRRKRRHLRGLFLIVEIFVALFAIILIVLGFSVAMASIAHQAR
jgi:hypothetical protein